MAIPLVDLKAQYKSIREEIDEAIHRVMEAGQFVLGPDTEALEEEVATFLGVRYAVGVASGTDALRLALIASGLGPMDEVITTPFTFIATAEAVVQCGARPVFVEIDPKTCNIDPAKLEIKVTKKTKAILPVHLYGQPADMDVILRLGKKYNLKVIEDCAQAFGAKYRGKRVGSLGDIGCLSFFPSKVLGAYGDGGMVVTNNSEIAQMVKILRDHGGKTKYHYLVHGFNSRLDSLQAAILRIKLQYVEEWIEQRRRHATLYSSLIGKIGGIQPPYIAPENYHVFNYYTILLANPAIDRDRLREHLNSQGIATAVYYPLSLHLQQVYQSLGHKLGDFPQSERAQEKVLSLPMYPELNEGQVEEIAGTVRDYVRRLGRVKQRK